MVGGRQVSRKAGMSALGHKRTLEAIELMSALPPKADIETQASDVRFVPKADICSAAIQTATRSPRRQRLAALAARQGPALWRSSC
jgi:hypothetical protein